MYNYRDGCICRRVSLERRHLPKSPAAHVAEDVEILQRSILEINHSVPLPIQTFSMHPSSSMYVIHLGTLASVWPDRPQFRESR